MEWISVLKVVQALEKKQEYRNKVFFVPYKTSKVRRGEARGGDDFVDWAFRKKKNEKKSTLTCDGYPRG